jgi:hypothetical protein
MVEIPPKVEHQVWSEGDRHNMIRVVHFLFQLTYNERMLAKAKDEGSDK